MSTVFSKSQKVAIDWQTEAKPMIEKYLCHPEKVITTDNVPLEYIRISKDDISELLQNDDIKEVLVFLAVSYDDFNRTDPNEQDFTFVIAGAECVTKADGSTNLEINTDLVYNQFKPCPDECLKYKDIADKPSRAVSGAVDPC